VGVGVDGRGRVSGGVGVGGRVGNVGVGVGTGTVLHEPAGTTPDGQ
jgi:hypothetical protein